jgi:hypothetical protein
LAITLKEAQAIKLELEPEYQTRHEAFRRLRGYWGGQEYWRATDREASGIASIFRDLRGTSTNVGPDIKLVNNLLQEVCVKYQSFLSGLPMIRVYREPGTNLDLKERQANKKERYLYGTWNQRPYSMKSVVSDLAWYLPLMGDTFLGAFPDVDNKIVRPIVRGPENAYPIMSYDGTNLDAVIFAWKEPESKIARKFPNYTLQADLNKGRTRFIGRRRQRQESNPKVEILEFSDQDEFARWAGEQKLNGVEHNYKFNLFDQIQFIHIPGEPWGHGAVEQAVGMVEAQNAMYSLVMQSMLDNVFPQLVLEDPSKAPEEIERGAGAVLPLNPGGKAYYLNPPSGILGVQSGFINDTERKIKQATGMPEASFGSFEGGVTHVSGKAINEMQGAGTGSMIEMVQGNGIGTGMVSFNEKAIMLAQTLFKNDTMKLAGFETGSAMAIVPRYFSDNIKGSELVGSCRNEVVFSPHLNLHEKLVMGLQGLGAGLWSKQYVREQTGIPDSEAMDEEIMGEKVQEIILGSIEQSLLAQPDAQGAASAESQALAFLQGATPATNGNAAPSLPSAPPAGPLGQGGPPPGGPPIGPLGTGGGQAMAPALQLPPGAALGPEPQGQGPGGAPPAQNPNTIKLDEAVKAFQALSGLKGKVYLVGEIVQNSETNDDIEVSITNPDDKQVITDGLPQWAGRITFHTISKEPIEPHIEVTPGAVPEQKGEAPDLSALMPSG